MSEPKISPRMKAYAWRAKIEQESILDKTREPQSFNEALHELGMAIDELKIVLKEEIYDKIGLSMKPKNLHIGWEEITAPDGISVYDTEYAEFYVPPLPSTLVIESRPRVGMMISGIMR